MVGRGSRAKSPTQRTSHQVYWVVHQPVRYKIKTSLWGSSEAGQGSGGHSTQQPGPAHQGRATGQRVSTQETARSAP